MTTTTHTPRRVQRTRTAGQPGIPPGSKYVGRGTRWGNPFRAGVDADDNEHAVELFRTWLEHDDPATLDPYGSAAYRQEMSDRREWMLAHAGDLAGLDLACWCKPDQPCHADVLLELPAAASSGSPVGARENGGVR